MTDKTPTEIAGAYTEALESQADDGEYEEVRKRLDGLREHLERFEDTYTVIRTQPRRSLGRRSSRPRERWKNSNASDRSPRSSSAS